MKKKNVQYYWKIKKAIAKIWKNGKTNQQRKNLMLTASLQTGKETHWVCF